MSYTIVMSVALVVVTQAAPRSATQGDAAHEKAGLLGPTPIRLDFDNRTLNEIVTLINDQSSISVMLPPEPMGVLPGEPVRPVPPLRRFTLHEPDTSPFWKAIDRLCGTVQCWPGIAVMRDPLAQQTVPGRPVVEPDPRVVLVPSSGHRGFVFTDGAFRIVVARLSYGRDIRFAPAVFPQPRALISSHDQPGDQTVFTADLIFMVEPRLKIVRLGDLAIAEATDDRGRNLITAGSGSQPLKDRPGLIPADAAAITIPVALNDPSDHGKLIKRLRGNLEVGISARKGGSQPVATAVAFDFADIPMP